MADYTFTFTAEATANPWTPSAPIKKSSSNNLQLLNGSGVKSATNSQVSYGCHDVDYTLGATQILSEVDIGTVVYAGDRAGPAIIARSGGNAGAGYAALPDNYGGIYVYRVSAAGALTQIGYVGSITLANDDLIGLGYVQSTDTLTIYQNATQRTTVVDATYNADTTLGAGWLHDPTNLNAQYLQALHTTGVAASGPAITSVDDSTPADGGQIVITCTNAGATAGTVTIDGSEQTVVAWSETEITATLDNIDCYYNANVDLIITDSDDNASAAEVIQVTPPSGWIAHTTSGTLADPEYRLPYITSGDQIAAGDVQGGNENDIQLFDDGSYAVSEIVRRFSWRYNDGTGWFGPYHIIFTNRSPTSLDGSKGLAAKSLGTVNR